MTTTINELVQLGLQALQTGIPQEMAGALKQMGESDQPPLRGVRLMLQAQLGNYALVLKNPGRPSGATPEDLEDACHTHAALGVAHTQTGNFEEGATQIRIATAFAQAAGLNSRVGMLEIELERIMTLRGQPRPEQLQQLLLDSEMPDRRRAWGRRCLAEALMALGDYSGALASLGHASIDSAPDRALRRFLHGLLRLPDMEDIGDLPLPYSRLAAALFDPQAPVTHIIGEPQAGYANLLEALRLLRMPETASHALSLLGQCPPRRFDQALIHHLAWLAAVSMGLRHPNISQLFAGIEQFSTALRTPAGICHAVASITPSTSVLLALGGSALQRDIALREIPLLIGSEILWRGRRYKLPGRTGIVMVCMAAGADMKPLARAEKSRVLKTLRQIGLSPSEVVNMGDVIRHAKNVRTAVMRHPALFQNWDTVPEKALEMTSSAVRDALKMGI